MTEKPLENELEQLQRRIRVAQGDEAGDVVLTGGTVVNVFTERLQKADVVIADGRIAAVGPYEWSATEQISVEGGFILPAFIDAHMHVESSLLAPAELARLVVPQGTAVVVADPHEVANVSGLAGIEMLLQASADLPLDIFFMAPSCVPASRWEAAGAKLGPEEIDRLLQNDRVLGLAEVMDFPGVLAGRRHVLEKILTAGRHGSPVDGHAPGLTGRQVLGYTAAGIRSDHESTTAEEARAKAEAGMLLQVREGSSARNLETLLPLLVDGQLGEWCLVTDDIHPDDLTERGHLNALLRRVVAAGVPFPRAVRHLSLVPARHYNLQERGAVAPGYRADLLVMGQQDRLRPRLVMHGGEVVARAGEYVAEPPARPLSGENTIHLGSLSEEDFRLPVQTDPTPVVEALPDQIGTRGGECSVATEDGQWCFDAGRDVLLGANVERHRATGRVGLGLVSGFGLTHRGALGSSVAHDAHNLMLVGTHPAELLTACRRLQEIGGGFVVVSEGRVLAELPLPIVGLLSQAPAEEVCRDLAQVREAAGRLGCQLPRPFGTLSFLALSVIPELRITVEGLLDVSRQEIVPI